MYNADVATIDMQLDTGHSTPSASRGTLSPNRTRMRPPRTPERCFPMASIFKTARTRMTRWRSRWCWGRGKSGAGTRTCRSPHNSRSGRARWCLITLSGYRLLGNSTGRWCRSMIPWSWLRTGRRSHTRWTYGYLRALKVIKTIRILDTSMTKWEPKDCLIFTFKTLIYHFQRRYIWKW